MTDGKIEKKFEQVIFSVATENVKNNIEKTTFFSEHGVMESFIYRKTSSLTNFSKTSLALYGPGHSMGPGLKLIVWGIPDLGGREDISRVAEFHGLSTESDVNPQK